MKEKTIQNNVMVIVAGQMGSGIAQLFAMCGFHVTLHDISDISIKKARIVIQRSLDKLSDKCALNESASSIVSRIKFTNDLSKTSKSKIIIESAFEDFETKHRILNSLNRYINNTTYIASNTSSFSISDLAKAVSYPENFIGFHFMNPVILMELVEIIRGISTSDETVQFFQALSENIGKTAICVKNSPGFVLNRILIPMINEAAWTLYEGVSSAEEIDMAMKCGANHKMGPLALADLIGLDTVLAILRTLQEQIDKNKYIPSPLLSQYISVGKLGRKSGSGFFSYD